MKYECILKRGFDDYYLELEQGKRISLSSIAPYLESENGTKIENDRFIMYSIKGIDSDGKSCIYNIRVGKKHLQAYETFIEDFDSRCKSVYKTKKINKKRLAIIGLSFILVASTPATIKAVKDGLQADMEDWKARNSAPDYIYDDPEFNPELYEQDQNIKKLQKEELEKEKYHLLYMEATHGNESAFDDLRKAALSGNEIAQQEFVNYLYENSLENVKGNSK